jgi:hypothetical protein
MMKRWIPSEEYWKIMIRNYKKRIRNINGMNTPDIMDELIIQNIEYRINQPTNNNLE